MMLGGRQFLTATSALVLLAVALLAPGKVAADFSGRVDIANQAADLARLVTEATLAWRLRDIEILGRGTFDMELQTVELFAQNAKMVVDDGEPFRLDTLPRPRYLRGHIHGVERSAVALSVDPEGGITGLINDGMATWTIQRRAWDEAIEATPLAADAAPPQPFRCGTDQLIEPPEVTNRRIRDAQKLSLLSEPVSLEPGQLYQVTVAIETDHELYAQFGSELATISYIGDVFNYINAIYELETQTRLLIGDVFLWSNAAEQPWVENDNTGCRLYEFGLYWLNHRSNVNRTLAHFLSGRLGWAGTAWLDALCQAPMLTNQPTGCGSLGDQLVFGDFGVSGGLTGAISTPGGIAWDAMVVAHEIGHNFNSPHTHCYGGIDNHASPVDACFNTQAGPGCWNGSESLPGLGSLTGGTSGSREGTIMSYCHRRPGGIGNLAATFGAGHPFGVQAARVPNRMTNTVATTAAGNPSCVPIIGSGPARSLSVLRDGTGLGQVSSEPTGIDCGTTCTASFPFGSSVQLTATAESGSDFTAWSGDGCSGTGVCTVTMDDARIVTATFEIEPAVLLKAVPVTNLAGAADSERYFSIMVPDGATGLNVTITGGSGDADLYLRFGALPSTEDYLCRPLLPGNEETCEVMQPSTGTYYVLLRGYSAYEGVTLTAIFSSPTCDFEDQSSLANTILEGTHTYGACHRLIAGPNLLLGAGADVSLVAGERIALRPGISIMAGASFRARIDAGLLNNE